MLSSPSACRELVESNSPAIIASQLQRDQELCRSGVAPSILAFYVPAFPTVQGEAISEELIPLPQTHQQSKIPKSMKKLHYDGVVNGIKTYLQQMQRCGDEEEATDKTPQVPTTEKFEAAWEVLEYLRTEKNIASLEGILAAVKAHITSNLAVQYANRAAPWTGKTTLQPIVLEEGYDGALDGPENVATTYQTRKCYICLFRYIEPHSHYPALCRPCGDFNIAESSISLPGRLSLKGRLALVTGGRVNLGFTTALHLLRCSARIIGAEFRSAAGAFRLVAVVKAQVKDWTAESGSPERLDILINNAAQTLTDHVQTERKAIQQEQFLKGHGSSSQLLINEDSGYSAQMRGGMRADLPAILCAVEDRESFDGASELPNCEISTFNLPTDQGLSQTVPYSKSSWVQSLSEIPFEDVISAHSVNFFVPLILYRELLPIMGMLKHERSSSTSYVTIEEAMKTPSAGYIVNVSSREGIFENTPMARMKGGKHVHTNTSKAALNMITETEAGTCWQTRRVAMNTVDPRYMSAAPEMAGVGVCPMGWEDGAGRVLWPIAVGEMGRKEKTWGRFLKHFGSVKSMLEREDGMRRKGGVDESNAYNAPILSKYGKDSLLFPPAAVAC